jgi:hypothetical protein
MVAGPAFAGLMVGMGAYPEYVGMLVVCCVLMTLLASRLKRELTPVQNGPVVLAA